MLKIQWAESNEKSVMVPGRWRSLCVFMSWMVGAGCCINDFFDQDFDKLVSRTTNRPLASGQISNIEALYFIFFQLLLGLWVILQFNMKAIFFGFLIMPLVFTYPLFKRVT